MVRNLEVQNDPGFPPDGPESFKNKFVYIPMSETIMAAIKRFDISEDEMGISEEEIKYCFNMSTLVDSINVVILLPFYCKRIPTLTEDRGKYLASFQVHKSLVGRLRSKVKVSPCGRIGEPTIREVEFLGTVKENTDDTRIIRLPFFDWINEHDHIEIEIFHSTLPLLNVTEQFWANEVLNMRTRNFWVKDVMERIDSRCLITFIYT
jgi:hypothetical protein